MTTTRIPAPDRRRLRIPAFLGLLLAGTLLSGCAIFHKSKPIPCPHIGILGDAANLTAFRPGGGHDITDVDYKAEVEGLSGTCSSAEHGKAIDMNVSLRLIASAGPALQGTKIGVPYFVSVIDHKSGQILAKADFISPINFPSGHRRAGVVEQVNEHIPVAHGRQGPDFDVLVGLQLTEAQLDYNRSHTGE